MLPAAGRVASQMISEPWKFHYMNDIERAEGGGEERGGALGGKV